MLLQKKIKRDVKDLDQDGFRKEMETKWRLKWNELVSIYTSAPSLNSDYKLQQLPAYSLIHSLS
jgi:hypothetical protein